MKIRLLLIGAGLVFALSCRGISSEATENVIKQGNAIVNLTVESDGTYNRDSLSCEIVWNTLLDVTNDGTWRIMKPAMFENGTAVVPMETLFSNRATLTIKSPKHQAIKHISLGLSQDCPLNLTIHLNKDNRIVKVDHSGGTGHIDTDGRRSSILMNYGSTTVTDKNDWEDYNRFLEWQMNDELPRNLRDAFRDVDLSDADKQRITDHLTLTYCTTRILPYVRRAKKWAVDFLGVNPDDIQQPPAEFYRFLNNIDFSPAVLEDFSNTLRQTCTNIMKDLPVGIKPIGNSPVAEWQSDVKNRLNGIIDNPTQLLLDLLTATSYFNQIQYDRTPLTSVQMANIREFYGDSDLGKIILDRNDNPFPNIFSL